MDNSLQQRGKALEDNFFRQKDQQLIEKLRAEIAAKEGRTAMSQVSGITDEAALDALAGAGITPESMTSVSLIPLVAVAWADGKLESSEKDAILRAAEEAGIEPASANFEILQKWLEEQPGSDLLESWKAYVTALKENADPAAMNQLKTSVLGRARHVAEAAGGFLGFGNKVSEDEEKVLTELTGVF